MSQTRSSAVFGKRKEPHTIIIAHGDDIRHFTVRPWMAALCGSVLAAIAIGYLLATSYLVLRDDLIGATVARQARLQQAYEDRISALRTQVDRITSRQLLDQRLMESKVAELLDRQEELSERNGRMLPLLEKAAGASAGSADIPIPSAKPEVRADIAPANAYAASAVTNSAVAALARITKGSTAGKVGSVSIADRADLMFLTINKSLREIESRQLEKIRTLTENAYKTADTIVAALESAGLEIDATYGSSDAGGPLVPVTGAESFDSEVEELDEALSKLDSVRDAATKMPIANPAPGRVVTSGFGVRRDPLIGKPAFHAGIDFRASIGLPVHATGTGTVSKAGWNGGYGRMVEIDHGDGLTTRFAHLSEIKVTEGQAIEVGQLLGLAGSSGRSTGPHIHYEIRRDDKPLNPVKFLKAGKAIGTLL